MMRVVKGSLIPADAATGKRMVEAGYRVGDLLLATFTKPRNPAFNGLAHLLGGACVDYLPGFENETEHSAIKRLQLESGIECDVSHIEVPGIGTLIHKTARSLSFPSMDEIVFKTFMKDICRYIADKYWADIGERAIAGLEQFFVDE